MAYTFDELFTNSSPFNPVTNEYYAVLTTIVVTQEDGRSAYGNGLFEINHDKHALLIGINNADPAFDFYMSFSDRARFTGQADHFGITISGIDPSTIHVDLILKSWGNTPLNFNAALPSTYATYGKLYQGWGDTIGGGTGRALHCISFNEIQRQTVVIL